MDGTPQNPPADIPALLAKLQEGYDVVLGQRANRQDAFLIRKLPSLAANWLIRKVTKVPFRDFGCTLRAMRRDHAQAPPLHAEKDPFVPAPAPPGPAPVPLREPGQAAGPGPADAELGRRPPRAGGVTRRFACGRRARRRSSNSSGGSFLPYRHSVPTETPDVLSGFKLLGALRPDV